ncbi:MAG: carbohydrate-binding domain-containing protein [Prevotella sp.]|nr:carbohydrate-binding domain-containing protein [Prevotella sp.]
MKKITSIALLFMLATISMTAQNVIDIVYNGNQATVNLNGITDVTSTVSGANVTIKSKTTSEEYTYRVSGTSTDGSLYIEGEYKLTLQLAGVKLTNASNANGGYAIDVECGKRIAVELEDGTVNTLCDVANGGQKAALYFKGHAEFKGGGTLNVSGKTKHAIRAKEYIELKSSTGTINILEAVSDGIHCGKGKPDYESNYFLMKGGIVNITNVGGDGIDSDDYGAIKIHGGTLSVNIKDDASGLKADSTVTIKDGTINISVKGNDSKGIRANHTVTVLGGKTTILVDGDGSKGIKAKNYKEGESNPVINGGYLNINGGNLNIQCTGDNLEDGTKCVAVSVDADLTQTDGDVDITVTGPEAIACTVDGNKSLTGGSFNTKRIPWKVQTRDYQYDMTVYVAVNNNGVRLANYDKVAVGAFIGDECVGYGIFEDDYGVIRVKSNDESAKAVSFKIYRFTDKTEYDPTTSKAITFANQTSEGEPSNPIVLSCSMKLEGDVNGDGTVDANDVVEIVNYLMGKKSDKFIENAADANGDDTINAADIVTIVNIIMESSH